MNGAVIPKIIWLVVTFTPTTPGAPINVWQAPNEKVCRQLETAWEQFQMTRCIPFETRR